MNVRLRRWFFLGFVAASPPIASAAVSMALDEPKVTEKEQKLITELMAGWDKKMSEFPADKALQFEPYGVFIGKDAKERYKKAMEAMMMPPEVVKPAPPGPEVR